jgi:RNA polymerase sigma-70 factor (ECF subfamily)
MADPADSAARWLPRARAGDREALGQALEECRGYLLMIARQELDPELRSKGGASDLVQETFLEAQRDFPRFQGTTEEELLAWLRQILLHNLVNFRRRYMETAKRQVAAEVSLEAGRSPSNWAAALAAPLSTPSEHAIEQEEELAVRQALERLPADYRQIILLRHEQELPFEEIGRQMGRSANAAQKLWARAVERLQHELEPCDDRRRADGR